MRNQISYVLSGRYALFTDPLTKIGGEKSTLMIPTYQALKGACESIYWKPTIIWVVDSVEIKHPIRTESKGIRPIKYSGGNDLSYYTYLRDVEYLVKAHFEFNLNRPDLAADRNEDKHYAIAKRALSKGGRRDIFLGCRECQGYVEPVIGKEEDGFYKETGEMDFGLMYHSISYPDENGNGKMETLFWHPKMVDGVIRFCRPEDCEKRVQIREVSSKMFTVNDIRGIDEEYEIVGGGE